VERLRELTTDRVNGPAGFPRIALIGAAREESQGREGCRKVLGRFQPDWCVIGEPSGWEGLTIGYKGSQQAVVAVNCSPDHSAGETRTAPEAAAAFGASLRAAVGGDEAGDNTGSTPAGPGFGILTCSLRAIRSSDADGLTSWTRMRIGFRLPPGFPVGGVHEVLLRAATDTSLGTDPSMLPHVTWQLSRLLPAYTAGKNNPLLRGFVAAIRGLGGTPRFKLKSGTSDMNLAGPAWKCPVLAYGPGDSRLDHTPEERIGLAEYTRAIAVWERLLKAMPGWTPIPPDRACRPLDAAGRGCRSPNQA
jgi:LysW-gamma-L-lysine carboxypeptidase